MFSKKQYFVASDSRGYQNFSVENPVTPKKNEEIRTPSASAVGETENWIINNKKQEQPHENITKT